MILPPNKIKPDFDCIYNNFPKEKNPEFNKTQPYGNKNTLTEMAADGVYKAAGGDLQKKHESGDKNYQNSCALKLSLALIKCGFTLPKEGIEKGGKGVILSAQNMADYLRHEDVLGKPTIDLTQSGVINAKNIWEKIGTKRGIVVFIPKSSSSFGATGHATIYDYSKYVSGTFVPHLYIYEDLKEVLFWEF